MISWQYESNHNNNIVKSCRILALHEVSRECVWLMCTVQPMVYPQKKMESTTIYKDNNPLFN